MDKITVDGLEFEVRVSRGGAKTMYQAWRNGTHVAGTYNKKYLKEQVAKAIEYRKLHSNIPF